MSAPERILAYGARNTKFGPQWKAQPLSLAPHVEFAITEYRRADLPPTQDEILADPRVQALVKALKPFADTVFNDNGDVTIDSSYITRRDYLRARTALRAIEGGGE
jgi:hypothetical protein